ncbi:MAG: hypothetical protein IPM96_01970 [Ignavibacteria bacterium]|nr:hypothetical protein [Ignavibacteria bacterium]
MENVITKHSGSVTEANKAFIFYSASVARLSIHMESFDEKKLYNTETEIQKNISMFEDKIPVYQRIIFTTFSALRISFAENMGNAYTGTVKFLISGGRICPKIISAMQRSSTLYLTMNLVT